MLHRVRLYLSVILVLSICAPPALAAQQKPPITPADYGKWETLGGGELSPDGKWLAYGISRSGGANELRVRSLTGDASVVAPFGGEPRFSDDSRWLAYSIGYSEQEQERLTRTRKPIQRKLGLLNLATREVVTVERAASFAFSKNGAYLAISRYPAERNQPPAPEGAAAPAGDRDPQGADLLIRDLNKGTDITFGNVSSFAWQDAGALLAMAINPEGRSGGGVQVYDPSTGALRVLDSSSAIYLGLTWKKDDDDLAVLRSKRQAGYEEETFSIIAWKDLTGQNAEKKVFDHTAGPGLPPDTRVVRYQQPVWSDTGTAIFFGVKEWTKKPAGSGNAPRGGEQGDEEEPAGVEVWHTQDISIIPEQRLLADRNRLKNALAVWHLNSGRAVKLGDDAIEEVRPVKGGRYAVGRETKPYSKDEMFGRPFANVYVIDTETGQRKKVLERLRSLMGSSPDGRYVLYFKDNHFWTYDIQSGAHTNITKSISTPLTDLEDDHPVDEKAAYGIAGWTRGDQSVIVYDQYDLWEVRADGSKATRLTNGAGEEVRYRYARLDPREEFIDTAKPMYLSAYGLWNKRFGYARLRAGSQPERLVWADKNIGRLTKAKGADTYAYVVQAFDDSPDYFLAGPDLKDARQVTETNPFQGSYGWGRAELIEYKGPRGERLQGALFYPANYEAGKQYPMIVNIYEKLSQNLHNYSAPSERSPYNPAVFTGKGYFVLQPDIVFREREPGVSIVNCVTAAVNKVLESGKVDKARLGLVGHSWGGYGTAFTATQTNLFRAAVAGAALTNLISMYGSVFWNTGRPETDHFEVGQERMQVPLWEDQAAYVRNSPVFSVQNMKTPLLMVFGDKDGSVDWHQGLEMYNLARRAGKDFVMLLYPGENHGLRKKANQIDYHRRLLEWFGHYLQGDPAPTWMTKGMTLAEREQELKRLRERKDTPRSDAAK